MSATAKINVVASKAFWESTSVFFESKVLFALTPTCSSDLEPHRIVHSLSQNALDRRGPAAFYTSIHCNESNFCTMINHVSPLHRYGMLCPNTVGVPPSFRVSLCRDKIHALCTTTMARTPLTHGVPALSHIAPQIRKYSLRRSAVQDART